MMQVLGVVLMILGLTVAVYYLRTAFLPQIERPAVFHKLGCLAHLIAWVLMALAIVGLLLVL